MSEYELFTGRDWQVRSGFMRRGDGRITWAAVSLAVLIGLSPMVWTWLRST